MSETNKLLLWALDVPGPSYGLELIQRLADAGFTIRRSSIYVHLHQLENAQLIASRTEWPPPPMGLPRRLYWLTVRNAQEIK